MATINIMAPLLVGGNQSMSFEQFSHWLRVLKETGVDGITTDVWWGLAESQEGQFDWSYYDRLSELIMAAGLRWIPILSFHQCGGNVGDNVTIAIPSWVWSKLPEGAYVSEQGNTCKEYISPWSTDRALPYYLRFMRAFQQRYAAQARTGQIAEINISLGPTGELRYPSYNSHDHNTGWPTRGALQCYSQAAIDSFRHWAIAKYGSLQGVQAVWGGYLGEQGQYLLPPGNIERFFSQQDQYRTYGMDFFDWYSETLIEHGQKVMRAAISVFGASDAAFRGIDLGAKIPGVHWHMGRRVYGSLSFSDRLAELAAGLIRTRLDWSKDENGYGYRPVFELFHDLQAASLHNRVVVHFTCLEMEDSNRQNDYSLAGSLVQWVGEQAARQDVALKGENALYWTLADPESWYRMRDVLGTGLYQGLTLLRMNSIVENQTALTELANTVKFVHNRGSGR